MNYFPENCNAIVLLSRLVYIEPNKTTFDNYTFILDISNVIAHQAITSRHHGTAIYLLIYYTL